ncbi:hypothetical protein ABIF91_003171 [Bradyrhizobium sp. USDA 241]
MKSMPSSAQPAAQAQNVPPLGRVHVAIEGEQAGVLDLGAFDALARIGGGHVRFPGNCFGRRW